MKRPANGTRIVITLLIAFLIVLILMLFGILSEVFYNWFR